MSAVGSGASPDGLASALRAVGHRLGMPEGFGSLCADDWWRPGAFVRLLRVRRADCPAAALQRRAESIPRCPPSLDQYSERVRSPANLSAALSGRLPA